MTTHEASELLKVSPNRVRQYIRDGTLIAVKHGRDWRIDPASVEALALTPPSKGGRGKRRGAL